MKIMLLDQIKCNHLDKPLEFIRNIHGDEINYLNARSIWKCLDCGKIILRSQLYEKIKPYKKIYSKEYNEILDTVKKWPEWKIQYCNDYLLISKHSKKPKGNNMDIAELEKEFAKLGILIKNEDGTYKFVEEIMQDICLALRKIRQNESEQDYKIKKNYILNLLVGERLKNELM